MQLDCPDVFDPGQLDENFDGIGDACADIPTVGEWGVVALALLVLCAGIILAGRARTLTS